MSVLRVKKIHPDANLPFFGTPGSAGLDLHCLEACVIPSKGVCRVRTGVSVELPEGHFGQISIRSSWATLGLIGLGGVIDNDYRGEIIVVVYNLSPLNIPVSVGMRVGQMVCIPYSSPSVLEVVELPPSERGEGGFGSTGV